jgi:O-antigen/teichoic acid export membrane protein
MSTSFSIRSFYQRIAGNVIYLFVGIGITSITIFASNIILARFLGIKIFGALTFLLGMINIITMMVDLGLFTAATKRIAEELGRSQSGILGTVITSFQRTTWLAGMVGSLVCGWLVVKVPFPPLEKLHIAGIWMVGLWVLVPTVIKSFKAIFNGFEDMRYTLVSHLLLEPLKFIGLILLLLTGSLTLPVILWSWTLIYLLSFAAILLLGRHFLAKRVKTFHKVWQWSDIVDRLRESFVYFLPYVGVNIMPSLVIVILGLVSTELEIAWFASSASLVSISFLVLKPMAQALLPAFTHRYARSGQVIMPTEGMQLLRMLALFNVCVLLGFLWLGPTIMRWTYGIEFGPAVTVLVILAAVNFFESFRLGVDPLLFSINAVSMVSRIELVRYAIMLPFIIGLGWRYGALGAAIGALLASMVCNVIRMYVLQTRLDIPGMEFALRFVVLVGAVLAGWQLGVSPLGVASAALLLGRGLGLYRLADLQVVLRIVPSLLRFR